VQDDGEFLSIDLTHLPVVTSSAMVSVNVVGGPTATPTQTPTSQCPPTPVVGCLAPGKSSFALGSKSDPSKNKLTWKWGKGAAVIDADLGDPTASTDYTLCVYGTPALLFSAKAPHGALWQATGGTPPKGYKYTDKLGGNAGITKVQVAIGDLGKSKAQMKGKGANLPGVTLPLPPGQLPVTVQLWNSTTSQCWTANYTNAPVKNDAAKLLLKLP
jgi:hypothetical protein